MYISHHFMHAAPKSQRDDDFPVDPTSERWPDRLKALRVGAEPKTTNSLDETRHLREKHVWLQVVVCCVTLRWFFMFLKKC